MQSSSVINSSNNQNYFPSQEDRTHIYQLLNELDNDQLRLILTKHLRNSSILNEIQHYTRTRLFQECFTLIENCYTSELEQTLLALRQKRCPPDFYQQQQQQQTQATFRASYNQEQPAYYTHTTIQYSGQPNYRLPSSTAIPQHPRATRPNLNPPQSTNGNDLRPPQQPSYITSVIPHPQHIRSSSPSTASMANKSSTSVIQQYQIPILSAPPFVQTASSSTHQTPILPATSNSQQSTNNSQHSTNNTQHSTNNSQHSTNNLQYSIMNKINYKNLPFYQIITCVYERYNIFHYDTYRKQNSSYDEFILPLDVCNQLGLSYDYDPSLNLHKTNKCLLLRLARIDQPATFHGQYEDNLPPNLVVIVNGHSLTNLPLPKASTRQQNDLIRIGREVDITSYIMFNPILKNEIRITWSYRLDNTSLHVQYANAKYALHIFLVEHLTIDKLCDKIIKKPSKFYRQDLVKLLAKARARDRDLGLEVSDQKLKLTCPIDQRRLRKPVRATTCHHLQCFDLTNYIALNEKSNKWICPVCNKSALYEDLQMDSYTESILNSIKNENIAEITINPDLQWIPVIQSKIENESVGSDSNINLTSSSHDPILIDD
ncbi:unnamed protein product [Rotaria sordida]|uniref:SP-RING-type domain-containing protein n=1 Tax=Rotaria sordida TaxID=392033 RepID=A0A813T4L1_9BILA|nr:unnamed protein product [Rotaria sordida]CAF3537900.1 unnamed protein product [Rotaria sordida]